MRLSNDGSEKWRRDAHKRWLTPFAFNDQAGGAVGRKPIVRTGAKVWNHSALESRIELYSIIIWSFILPPRRRRGCAKVR
jgi:hypothetical protein